MKKIYKVLIVDDVNAAHMLYKQALKDENYEILDAERGEEALSLLFKNDIDLLILDINLPDMSGTDVLRTLRSKGSKVPVLVLTAYGMREKVIENAGFGIEGYLIKPVDLDLFRKRVKKVLTADEKHKFDKLNFGTEGLLKELNRIEIDESLGDHIQALKKQIQGISGQIKELEKKQVEKKEQKNNSETADVIKEESTVCPVCGMNFLFHSYKEGTYMSLDTESDFHEIYDIVNPIAYDIIVCPKCYYAGDKNNFNIINDVQKDNLLNESEKRKIKYKTTNFSGVRDSKTGVVSYNIAIEIEEKKDASSYKLGEFYLKQAWLEREMGVKTEETKSLKKAIEYFEEVINKKEVLPIMISELKLKYMIGELSRRVGDSYTAQIYLMQVKEIGTKEEDYLIKLAEKQLKLIEED